MFFGVEWYKHMHEESLERLAVFDTKDCSCELVSYLEAEKNGIFIDNVYKPYGTTSAIGGVEDPFMSYLRLYGNDTDFVRYVSDTEFLIGDYKLKLTLAESLEDTFFAYPFLYDDYVILRYYCYDYSKFSYYWVTHAVNRVTQEVKKWDEFYREVDDKAFAMKIDTIFEV